MSRHGEVSILWGDGEYKFRLAWGQLRQLQEACDAGPPRIAARLRPYHPESNPHGDNWRVDDIRETIRLGLIGGGKSQGEALGLVMKFVDEVPLEQNIMIAWAIITEAITGTGEEALGKLLGVLMKATDSPTRSSPSPESMGAVQ